VRTLFVLLLAMWLQSSDSQTLIAAPQYFQYHRSLMTTASSGEACAAIDPEIFPHAAPSLKDLRLYRDGHEVPYAITLSEPEAAENESAKVFNLGRQGEAIVFDLQMPARSYTDVVLDLAGEDYLATATVLGTDMPGGKPTSLGKFTLFDLSAQHLSHNTTLHLQESNFKFLHIALTISAAPGATKFIATPQMVQGATVPPSREAQTLFTGVLSISDIQQRGRQTVGTISLPVRLPIERVSFVLPSSYKGNFSRNVRITAQAAGEAVPDTASGTILNVHLTETGREIQQQQLSIPAVLGANLQNSAKLEVAVDNGDDVPLPITAIVLEMRQRKLCFNAAPNAGSGFELYYGDSALAAPQYDFARLFSPTATMASAQLGPEQKNDAYRARPDTRSMSERHPGILWIVLLIVICILAVVALRSSKALPH
jgi:hypothetical protein